MFVEASKGHPSSCSPRRMDADGACAERDTHIRMPMRPHIRVGANVGTDGTPIFVGTDGTPIFVG